MKPLRLLFLLPWVVLAASCSTASRPPVVSTGSVQLSVSARQALASADVARVTVTASAEDVPAITIELVPTDGVWGGVIGDLPAGEHRAFLAQAFDTAGTLRYEGRVEDVTIVAGQLTLVTLTLQATSSSTPYSNEAPIIDSVVASPLEVSPGGQVTLVASAHDDNPDDTLAYAWTAPSGSFAAPTSAHTSWTAPSTPGTVALKLTVRDSSGAASSMTLHLRVSQGTGGAVVSVEFNNPPQVTAVTPSESNLRVGEQTALAASGTDADGDALSYQWSATCAGTFEETGTATTRFTPTESPAGTCNNCQVRVTVFDGRGGQATGTQSLCVAPAPAQHAPPLILRSYQSGLTARPGQALTFEVVASDPEGSALSTSWTATSGTLGTANAGTPTADTTSSRIVWTLPGCSAPGTAPGLVATVSNAWGLTVTRGFSVTGLPACSSTQWTPVGDMMAERPGHTATLLPNGKVLIVGGGQPPQPAKEYDPATRTWSITGAMLYPRSYHTATLLPDGKVLVAGGHNLWNETALGELYDPVTRQWSMTGAMSHARYWHTAVRMKNGKVLALGGFGRDVTMTAEEYDPLTQTWSPTASMSMGHAWNTTTPLPNGKILVTGGYRIDGRFNEYLAAVEEYDPDTRTWSLSTPMSVKRHMHTATLLPNGKVLVLGGNNSDSVVAMAEEYDPALRTWASVGLMRLPRTTHTATLLANGQVLVAGGWSYDEVAQNGRTEETADLYDPTNRTWAPTASMSVQHQRHTATLLRDGTVLVASGFSPAYFDVVEGELYTP